MYVDHNNKNVKIIYNKKILNSKTWNLLPSNMKTSMCGSHGREMPRPHVEHLSKMTAKDVKVPLEFLDSENPKCFLGLGYTYIYAFEAP